MTNDRGDASPSTRAQLTGRQQHHVLLATEIIAEPARDIAARGMDKKASEAAKLRYALTITRAAGLSLLEVIDELTGGER